MHVIDEPRDGVRVGVLPDAVAEIEDMTGRAARVSQHRIGLATQIRRRCKERGRIKIALHGFCRTQYAASRAERAPPINTHYVDIKFGDCLQKPCAGLACRSSIT